MLNEIKKLGRHTVIYGMGLIISKAIGFFLIPFYTRYFEPSDYGILELLDVTSYFVAIFIGMGINNGLMKYYYSYDSEEEKQQAISTTIIFTSFWGIVVCVPIFLFSGEISWFLFESNEYKRYVEFVIASVYIVSLYDLAKTIIRAKQKPVAFTVISLSFTAMAVCLNIYFIAFQKTGIIGIFYSSIIAGALILTALTIYWLKHNSFSFDFVKWKNMMGYSIYFVPTFVFAFALQWSDRFILNIYHDTAAVGLYSLGFKIGMILPVLIATPFAMIWDAYIFDIQKRSDAKEIYARVATYYLLALAFVGVSLAIYSHELIVILATPSYLSVYQIIPMLVLAQLITSLNLVFRVGLLIEGKSHILPVTRGVAAVFNVALNLLLIPKFGAMGAAWATVISLMIYIMVLYYFAQRSYPINFEIARMLKIVLVSAAVYFISTFISVDSLVTSILLKLLPISTFFLLLLVSNFFHTEERMFIERRVRTILSILPNR